MAKGEPLDVRTLRMVVAWHRAQYRKSDMPSAWEAHLVSAHHWLNRARSITRNRKQKEPNDG